ncbi:MAG: ribosome biogenesis GTP-binding protein YihA/YsxC [Holosporaceae bacterium]|jgi:GTP-binding protein|nr:ribosome biogenesis GTP-binding protein YihA/YsxC [Holosporaceae bacterium]
MTLKQLFGSECKFIAGAALAEQIPPSLTPEAAFVGRSNVGKSSLINAVVGGKGCARVSKSPGCTRQINFFSLGDKVFLADLPGYGYAAVSRETGRQWRDLTFKYLTGRPNLRRVFLLTDARRGIGKNDEEVMDILDVAAVPYLVVLTKIDKIKGEAALKASTEARIGSRAAAYPAVLLTSSEKFIGIRELQAEIFRLV